MGARDLLTRLIKKDTVINDLFRNCEPVSSTGGGGAFSVVFRGERLRDGAAVAIKFLDDGGNSYRRLCFEREGRLLNSVLRGDESVVQLLAPPQAYRVTLRTAEGIEVANDYPFLAFEWMAGGTLEHFAVRSRGPKEVRARLVVFREACKRVQRLHVRHLIYHRDLKFGNFLADADGYVRLSDFGTARLIVPGEPPLLKAYAEFPGDARYTAPEMLAGLHIYPEMWRAADLYSLGCMLFEMLTGLVLSSVSIGELQRLFDFAVAMHQIPEPQRKATFDHFLDLESTSRVPDACGVNPDVPACLRQILARLLDGCAHFDYRKRFADWNDLFRLVDIAIRVLDNEQAYSRMLAQRRLLRLRRQSCSS